MKIMNLIRTLVTAMILTVSSLSMAHEYLPAKDKMAQRIDQWTALVKWYEGSEPGNPKLLSKVGDVHYKKIEAMVARTPKFEEDTKHLLKALVNDTLQDELETCQDYMQNHYLDSILDVIRRSIHNAYVEIRFFGTETAEIEREFAQAKALIAEVSCENAEALKVKYENFLTGQKY